jgi:MFS family permease
MGLGQGLLNVADPAGTRLFILVSILISLAVIPMLLSARPGPSFAAPMHVDARSLYRTSPLGVVGMFGTVMAHGAFFGMGAVYGRAAGLSLAEISLLIGLWLLGGVVAQWPIGRLSDALDRRRVLTAITFAAALLAWSAAFQVGRPVQGLLVLVALYGGLALPMYSVCLAHTKDFLAPKQMVQASGTLVLIGGIGAALGPVSVAVVTASIGPAGFFWWLAAIHAAIGLFAVWRMTRRRAPPVAEQRPHIALPPRATPAASVLYAEAVEAETTPAQGSARGSTGARRYRRDEIARRAG